MVKEKTWKWKQAEREETRKRKEAPWKGVKNVPFVFQTNPFLLPLILTEILLKADSKGKWFQKSQSPITAIEHQKEELPLVYVASWGVDGQEEKRFLAFCLVFVFKVSVISC